MRLLEAVRIPGLVTGLVTGLLVGGLAAVAGAPPAFILVASLGLGIPLAFFGNFYDALLDSGRLRFGGVAPAVLFGVATFPAARLLQELLLTLIFGRGITLQQESGVLPFLAFQAIMGVGYGIGFLMIHSQIIEVIAWRRYHRQIREEGQTNRARQSTKRHA